ncbi:cytidine deaminase [candidate division WOR-1 bacterium RIFOXYA12_FULL_43_27]|uniref:Cytidine deaminase n=1 Tax=candidate division WOR-1 bacterium RIFOXYC2_FULL_46_14 TaxID=1802587 RepID=A0A1F4U3R1_UNCSA|nr:MAG: cytidine deaminase [candidate division WOR-1 bacterium RIFOXYA12_FULL_43_27]OGC20060.1 MAG: cytidine deaminase [candidate division WOR-1 bacterium RIFOXYB2_FULL_46_45]OGC32204.1 MAG: cytidine deaminase [candidate division WOR-1 bacterium RIFOXYA2_FULL_46_56]OGC39604.1 MAG: cytidine deaminase [candidate division WOR-1 bacterium RIFOXYC2_FULL_46_14]
MKRPSWDEYFLKITFDAAERATCVKRKVGAIIVKNNRILSTGYNGAPKGLEHCTEATCLRKKLNIPSGERHELCRGLHAEQNAIIQAAVYGVNIEGGTLYCTFQPCVICVKMMLNAGIKRLVYKGDYPDKLAEAMLKESKMEVERV